MKNSKADEAAAALAAWNDLPLAIGGASARGELFSEVHPDAGVREAAEQTALTRDAWVAAIRALWTSATHREECLAAIELADARRGWAGGDLMDLYEMMAVTGA